MPSPSTPLRGPQSAPRADQSATPTRRHVLTALAAGLAMLGTTRLAAAQTTEAMTPRAPGAAPIDVRAMVIERARALAAEPYRALEAALPPGLAELDYDRYRRLEPRASSALWRDGPSGFEVQPLHLGFIYRTPVEINVVEDDAVRSVPYDPARFSFAGTGLEGVGGVAPAAGDIGHSGARVLATRGAPAVAREFMVFQGASYFRALAAGLGYGLSARGLAIGTGDARGEEFPDFTALWFERPPPGARHIVMHALLDGPSVAGAFTFVAQPSGVRGEPTRVGVNAALFPRRDVEHAGLAPLTSMYWFGPLERGTVDDYRPRVHDSDGLLVCTSAGEWLWRPLANPTRLQVSQFDTGGTVHGFGLVQRMRDPEAYEDLEADYHLRPSCWIEPHAEWPAGRVELVELPTDNEFNDNVVVYWRPDAPLAAGARHDVGYDMVWCDEPDGGLGLLRAADARSGAYADMGRQIVVDFDPPAALAGTEPPDPHALDAQVSTGTGRIENVTLQRHPGTGGLRLTFMLVPDGPVAELRARVVQAGRPVTETWLYRWTA